MLTTAIFVIKKRTKCGHKHKRKYTDTKLMRVVYECLECSKRWFIA